MSPTRPHRMLPPAALMSFALQHGVEDAAPIGSAASPLPRCAGRPRSCRRAGARAWARRRARGRVPRPPPGMQLDVRILDPCQHGRAASRTTTASFGVVVERALGRRGSRPPVDAALGKRGIEIGEGRRHQRRDARRATIAPDRCTPRAGSASRSNTIAGLSELAREGDRVASQGPIEREQLVGVALRPRVRIAKVAGDVEQLGGPRP